jgi:diguanylate cyclase (GGDEF)-like protein
MTELLPKSRYFRFSKKEIPEEFRDDFRKARWRQNRRYLRVASGISFLVGALLLFRHQYLLGPMDDVFIQWLYKSDFLFLIVISVIFLGVSFGTRGRGPSGLFEVGQRIFLVAVVIGFSLLTYIDLLVAGDFAAILGILLFVSVTVWVDTTFFLAVLITMNATVGLGFAAGPTPAVSADEALIEMALISVAGIVLFVAVNESRMKSFLNEKLLDQTVEKLEDMSRRDPLTKLFNRRLMNEDIDRLLSLGRRTEKHFSIILMDLDLFKKVNDGLGHAVGDDVLRETSGILVSTVRKSDRVYRFGGEEFLILLPETMLESAARLAMRLLKRFREHHFTGVPWTVTMSIGISESRERGLADDLLKLADMRLYAAKEGGRNRYVAEGFSGSSDSGIPEIPEP